MPKQANYHKLVDYLLIILSCFFYTFTISGLPCCDFKGGVEIGHDGEDDTDDNQERRKE